MTVTGPRVDGGTFVAIMVILGLAVVLDAVWKRSARHTTQVSA